MSYLCYWIGSQDFVLNSCFASRFAYHSKVPHGVASRHCFTSSRLTTDDDGLVLVVPEGKDALLCPYTIYCFQFPLYIPGHLFICLLCHRKYMRVHVTHVLARVGVDDCVSINRKLFVWIYSHQYDACK